MTDVTVGGETFEIAVDGDAALPVLLLCHPLGGDLHIWDAHLPEFTRHFRVVRYDSRGHGGSTAARAPYSVTRLGLDALAILDALEIDRAHVLGLSLGGAVAQWLLIHAPGRIERAVLANTAATFGPAASWNERILAAQAQGMDSLWPATRGRWLGEAFAAEHEDVTDALRRTFVATAPEGYAAACAALRDMDLREGLRQIRHPVLVIAGRNDPSATSDQADLLVEAIVGAKLVTLDTHHISAIEDPTGFAEAAIGFFRAKTAAPRQPVSSLPVARRPAGRRVAATRAPAPTRAAPAKPRTTEVPTPATPAIPAPKGKAPPKPPARKAQAKAAAPTSRANAAPKASANQAAPATAAAKGKPTKNASPPAAARKTPAAVAPRKTGSGRVSPKAASAPPAKAGAPSKTAAKAAKPANGKTAGKAAAKTTAKPARKAVPVPVSRPLGRATATRAKTPLPKTPPSKTPPSKAKAADGAAKRVAKPATSAKSAPPAKAAKGARSAPAAKTPAKATARAAGRRRT